VTTTLKIGTRASALAQAQSRLVADMLRSSLGREVELVPVHSEGDLNSAPLTQIGGMGVFVARVREAVIAGEVDVVVHSLKDLPTIEDPRVMLAAVPVREDPRDVLVARDGLTLGELPAGARIGTGSPRRKAQINALGLGVEVVAIRGNVDTRLDKVASGEYDAVVLARAGLIRLGRADEATEILDPIQMLPAPGQGALAVEVAAGSGELAIEIEGVINDVGTRQAVTAERALLRALEAGCSAPIGALADIAEGEDGAELWIRGVVAAPDGSHLVRQSLVGRPDRADEVGRTLAADLLAEGADAIMQEVAS
jgi:hydroxymethylbilane synthase